MRSPPFGKGRRRRPKPSCSRQVYYWDSGAGRLGGILKRVLLVAALSRCELCEKPPPFQNTLDIPRTFEYLLVESFGTPASVKTPPSPFPGANETL